MPETDPVSADNKAKIEILLKEYDTLRNETMSRTNDRFAIVGFIVAFIVFIGTQSEVPLYGRCLIGGLAILVVLALWFRFGQLIKRCAVRIADIEEKINNLMGEKLLASALHIGREMPFKRVGTSVLCRRLALEHPFFSHTVMDL